MDNKGNIFAIVGSILAICVIVGVYFYLTTNLPSMFSNGGLKSWNTPTTTITQTIILNATNVTSSAESQIQSGDFLIGAMLVIVALLLVAVGYSEYRERKNLGGR